MDFYVFSISIPVQRYIPKPTYCTPYGEVAPYTSFAFCPNTASIASDSTPSSANDSRASSYQSPALDAGEEPVMGAAADEPNRMRWNPNASTAGPTAAEPQIVSDTLRTKHIRHALYILILRFHSIFSFSLAEAARSAWASCASSLSGGGGAGVGGVGAPQAGGRKLT